MILFSLYSFRKLFSSILPLFLNQRSVKIYCYVLKKKKITFACNESPVKKSMNPFIIQEDGVSDGCTRAVKTMTFFCYNTIIVFIVSQYYCDHINTIFLLDINETFNAYLWILFLTRFGHCQIMNVITSQRTA